jgi:hypothetical protein
MLRNRVARRALAFKPVLFSMTPAVRNFLAFLLFGIAGFMALGFAVSDSEQSFGVMVFAILLSIVFPAAVGVHLLRSGGPNPARLAQLRNQTIDAEIQRLAIARSGRLTEMEVVSTLGLAAGDVKRSLEDMVRRELADVEVTDDGVLVYSFHEARHLEGARGERRLPGG